MRNFLLLFALLLAVQPMRAQNSAGSWTGYRGNLDNGYSLAKDVPLNWSDSTDESGLTTVFAPGRKFNKLAENRLPEGCMASPAVLDGAIYLRTRGQLYRIGKQY